MKDNNNHITYSAADIEKYWKGELSAAEQHAMEKAALEDSLLADAMEGYEASWPLINANNEDLQKRLSARLDAAQKNKVVAMGWWKIAAAVIIVAGAGWLYLSTNNKAKEALVKNEAPVATEKNKVLTEDSDTSTNSLLKNEPVDDMAVNNKKTPPASKPTEAISMEADRQAAAPAQTVPPPAAITDTPSNELAKADKESNTDLAEYKKINQAPAAAKEESPANATARKAKAISIGDSRSRDQAQAGSTHTANGYANNFIGNLTDQGNKPIANALIQIPKLKIATQTDLKGNFAFQAMDTVLTVSIAADGFETQNIRLHDSATLNQIVLRPVPHSADDVVVQTNGALKKYSTAAKDVSIKILDAEPVIGWTAYNQYLDKNKKLSAAAQGVHGTVVVSFTVHNKWLSNFTIEQPLDDELDEEAIRLIKNGPAWKLLKGKKASATVIVTF
jgi:cytoskeletal protein RodZ